MANIFLIYSLNICDSGAPAVSNTVGQAKARNDMRTCFSFCKLGTEKLSLVPLRNNSIVKLLLGQPAVGVNVKDIIGGTESQNFGVDPMTLPFLRFFLICYTPILRRIFFLFFLKKTDADRLSRAHFFELGRHLDGR